MKNNATPPTDRRGKHDNRPNQITAETVTKIHDHIMSFPKYKSHYSRSDNLSKYYLSPLLNTAKLHELYLKKHEPVQYEILQANNKSEIFKPVVKYEFFRKYFTENFNITFGNPKSDTCQKCDKLIKQIDSADSDVGRNTFQLEKSLHIAKAETFYTDLKLKSELARTNAHVEVITFDYQQNLPLPVSPSGDVFYKIQMWVYNFCIHVASSSRSYFFLYDETIAGKGQNEVISLLDFFFKNIIRPEVTDLYMFSDNCASQNKNLVMIQYIFTLIEMKKFKTIYHRFPEPGHSYLPCDRSFAAIEKRKRRYDKIYLPSEYVKIIRESGSKFEVITPNQSMFLNFKQHFMPMFKKNPSVKNAKFTISKYRIFHYDISKLPRISCSISVSVPVFQEFELKNKNAVLTMPDATHILYGEKRKLKQKKFEHVMALATNYVPANDQWFYDDIKKYHLDFVNPEAATSCSEFEDNDI